MTKTQDSLTVTQKTRLSKPKSQGVFVLRERIKSAGMENGIDLSA
jgi:hypothetical protein